MVSLPTVYYLLSHNEVSNANFRWMKSVADIIFENSPAWLSFLVWKVLDPLKRITIVLWAIILFLFSNLPMGKKWLEINPFAI